MRFKDKELEAIRELIYREIDRREGIEFFENDLDNVLFKINTNNNNNNMSKMKQLDEIAQGVACVALELMNDSVDWQISDLTAEGDEYRAIHAQVVQMAVSKMYEEVKR